MRHPVEVCQSKSPKAVKSGFQAVLQADVEFDDHDDMPIHIISAVTQDKKILPAIKVQWPIMTVPTYHKLWLGACLIQAPDCIIIPPLYPSCACQVCYGGGGWGHTAQQPSSLGREDGRISAREQMKNAFYG